MTKDWVQEAAIRGALLAKAEQERDRYRAALKEINNYYAQGYEHLHVHLAAIKIMAQDALEGGARGE